VTCELLRRDIFAGNRTPLIFGEPEGWVGALVQANGLIAKGQYAAAAKVRSGAFDAAPAVAGAVNGTAFEWIADADSRLGPLMEVILEGKYYWVPFSRIRKVIVEAPHDLRDLIWIAAQFVWSNGGTASGHIPVRYPGTEDSAEGALQLSRRTDWREEEGETFLGLGQRLFATDAGEFPLLECRTIELQTTT
jgi:type VI secretion system protein ImpE